MVKKFLMYFLFCLRLREKKTRERELHCLEEVSVSEHVLMHAFIETLFLYIYPVSPVTTLLSFVRHFRAFNNRHVNKNPLLLLKVA